MLCVGTLTDLNFLPRSHALRGNAYGLKFYNKNIDLTEIQAKF